MRFLVASCMLALCAVSASAAERITTSDGTSYTRAADGKLYPSTHVRPDGSVSLTPLTVNAVPAPAAIPWLVAPRYAPAPSPCPNGRCPNAPAPSLLPPSVIR
jgi:hypothetical protein